MQVTYDVSASCRLTVEVSDVKQAFQFIAYAGSVFNVGCCGNCESDDLKLAHRQPQGYDYYSVVCNECRHEFKFGQQKETGHLFPKGWEPPFESDGDDGGDDTVEHGASESQDTAPARETELAF